MINLFLSQKEERKRHEDTEKKASNRLIFIFRNQLEPRETISKSLSLVTYHGRLRCNLF